MPETWTIREVTTRTVGSTPCWQVMLERPDGRLHAHLMPTMALDARAAEYGIDPSDVDALLEVILHEPHMPTVDEGSGPRYADGAPDLWDAESTDAARRAHQARVQAAGVRVDVRGAKGLDVIRKGHRPDLATIRAVREAVDTGRWVKRYGDLPAGPRPKAPVTNPKEDARV
ncbi:hypothetical protein OG481_02220 [Streptomyces longwoodensis]|uniref:hypothetical protein n=1 Tax=Streptomyces longwoodensis TaxID=68231 RepID=UPI002DD7F815|nr:hypothetical protein [Streptomyces longwoodensis]WRY87409.1 hypothetical protein OG481_02220 [Streptomyces longwoodensis]